MIKNALVTGSGRGIGAAIARALHRNGWQLTLHYCTRRKEAEALARELGCPVVQADVSDPRQAEALIQSAGPVSLLVNNAGISHFGLLTHQTDEEWDRILAVNLTGVRNCCRAALPDMVRAKQGTIINIASMWGLAGASCEAAYSASKAGVIGLTQALAKEYGPSGIRVNAVAPGVIRTEMLDRFAPEELLALAEETPLGRLGTPEDVAELCAFLASDAAGFITGQTIAVDGGFLL